MSCSVVQALLPSEGLFRGYPKALTGENTCFSEAAELVLEGKVSAIYSDDEEIISGSGI